MKLKELLKGLEKCENWESASRKTVKNKKELTFNYKRGISKTFIVDLKLYNEFAKHINNNYR
ncbi:hypothetical protein BH10BAC5_BH10BAC5_17130 [soil metagenome]